MLGLIFDLCCSCLFCLHYCSRFRYSSCLSLWAIVGRVEFWILIVILWTRARVSKRTLTRAYLWTLYVDTLNVSTYTTRNLALRRLLYLTLLLLQLIRQWCLWNCAMFYMVIVFRIGNTEMWLASCSIIILWHAWHNSGVSVGC